jgi:hypothetical protein
LIRPKKIPSISPPVDLFSRFSRLPKIRNI